MRGPKYRRGMKLVDGNHGELPSEGTAIQRRSAVGARGGTDRNTDGALPLADSTSHTPKLSVAPKGIFFTLIYVCFLAGSRLYLFVCIQTLLYTLV